MLRQAYNTLPTYLSDGPNHNVRINRYPQQGYEKRNQIGFKEGILLPIWYC